jgi:hypothetical protein
MMNPPPARQYKDSSSARKWVIGFFIVVPILCCGGGVLYARKWVDTVDNSANLDNLVAEAKKQGFPFESKELIGSTLVPDSENSYLEINKLIKEFPDVVKLSKATVDFKIVRGGKIPSEMLGIVARSRAIGKFTKLDVHRDYDLGMSITYPEYVYLRQVARTLRMQGLQQVANGDASAALETLSLIRNLGHQLTNDKFLIDGLVNYAINRIYLKTASEMIGWLESDRNAVAQIKKVLDVPLESLDFKTVLKGEFFQGVTLARNYKLFGGLKAMASGKYPVVDPKKVKRSGLPDSMLERGKLAAMIENMLKVKGIVESEPNLAIACKKADAYEDAMPMTVSNAFPKAALPIWGPAGEAWLKPNLERLMLLQAIDLMGRRQGGEYPGSISDIPDPIAGGTVHYKRTAGGFMIYSLGRNKKDDGGPKNKTDRKESDDFGFEFPIATAK